MAAPVTGTILVVEDNQVLRFALVSRLKTFGLAVDIAENGLCAVEAVKHKHYDLILMDVAMPVMDGLEAARQIREMEAGSESPSTIVAVTASDTKVSCLSAGMDDFITKPADCTRILNKWLPHVMRKH